MLPVAASNAATPNTSWRLAAEALDVDPDMVLDYDLSLYTCQPATAGPTTRHVRGRLDDLSMVHAGLTALVDAADTSSRHTRVLAVFDNEETGSGTQARARTARVLRDILRRA